MTLNNRIIAFSKLGDFLSQFGKDHSTLKKDVLFNSDFYEKLLSLCNTAQHKNGWFLPEQVYFALQEWSKALSTENLSSWANNYNFTETTAPKTIGLVMAGNIPLVGFHDLLCILISGNKALIKPSSEDTQLIQIMCDYLIAVAPLFKERITFTEGKLKNFDAVIATGSNNTARYFEFYFKEKPNIIRKNRNSLAVLTGKETHQELVALGEDIFRYYGLGCRSVSKLFVPKDYNFDAFFKAMFEYQNLIKQEKYTNNYDYNKAVYLMSNYKLLDNGFMILKEDPSYSSPISSVFYEFYEQYTDLKEKFDVDNEKIQCIVNYPESPKNVSFGTTQTPQLWDYADGIDTLEFLLKI